MAIDIRLLKDNEAELANNFFNEIYGSHRSIENFRWEFFEGPDGKATYVVAVDRDDSGKEKIVGIQCAIPLGFISSSGEKVLTAKSEDTLVHPGYRGQKLFERMYDLLFKECRNAGIKYIWGFTPALKAFQRLGFEIPFQTTQALLVLKPIPAYRYLAGLNTANKLKEKSKIFGLSVLSWVSGLKSFGTGNFTISENEVTASNASDLLKTTDMYFLNETDNYINWRIVRNPFGNHYRSFSAVDSHKKTVAEVVVNYRKDVSYIEKMVFNPSFSFKDRKSMVGAVVSKMKERQPAVIRALCFDNNDIMKEQIALLKSVGFTHLNRGSYFVWKSLDHANLIDVKKVFFSRFFTQGNT